MIDYPLETREYNGKQYQVSKRGTWFSPDTPAEVCRLLDFYHDTNRRVRIFYGDSATGRDWGEENDVAGRIGRSAGFVKKPILLANSRSDWGGAILDNCIVKMIVGGRVVYEHPLYHQPVYTTGAPIGPTGCDMTGYTTGVYADGSVVANFRSELAAQRWIDFMTGRRMGK